ncbi:Oxysterol-binding protein-related protein 1B [Thelohanellus kitauei]|uniref:Oxysterol-binding protein-related protein 1B n=1 Tax=Thelohanellus kitauei TaxID=669202 RepID=A0A0C2J2S3_THEKT|nr:Oxysterol-binding protein-related protein 1B [Thelohanellus kitauei]
MSSDHEYDELKEFFEHYKDPEINYRSEPPESFERPIISLGSIFGCYKKLKINIETNLKIKFKDGEEYHSNLPPIYYNEITTNDPWSEIRGTLILKHKGDNSRADIKFLGCKKYSTTDCVEGQIFDNDGNIQGFLRGNYMTNVLFKRTSDGEETTLWDRDDFKCFPGYFGFSDFTLKLNDDQYPTDCITDSRKRPDLRDLEIGKLEERARAAEKKRKQEKTVYQPRWFTMTLDESKKKTEYVYNGDYWKSKLSGSFGDCPELF